LNIISHVIGRNIDVIDVMAISTNNGTVAIRNVDKHVSGHERSVVKSSFSVRTVESSHSSRALNRCKSDHSVKGIIFRKNEREKSLSRNVTVH